MQCRRHNCVLGYFHAWFQKENRATHWIRYLHLSLIIMKSTTCICIVPLFSQFYAYITYVLHFFVNRSVQHLICFQVRHWLPWRAVLQEVIAVMMNSFLIMWVKLFYQKIWNKLIHYRKKAELIFFSCGLILQNSFRDYYSILQSSMSKIKGNWFFTTNSL